MLCGGRLREGPIMTEPGGSLFSRVRLPKLPKLALRWPNWTGTASVAALGKLLWPIVIVAGVLAAGYFAATSNFVAGPPVPMSPIDPAATDSSDYQSVGGASPERRPGVLRAIGLVVLVLAALAALVWLLKWLSAQGLAPRLATASKLALALAPVAVWPLANLDGVYHPMREPLRSYLLLIACPFVATGVLVALDRRRAWWLGLIAVLVLAGLFVGAGAIGRGPLESVEHLRTAALTLSPDQRMWWLALAAMPVAVFALVSAIGDEPSA